MDTIEIEVTAMLTIFARRALRNNSTNWFIQGVKDKNRLKFSLFVAALKAQADKYIRDAEVK